MKTCFCILMIVLSQYNLLNADVTRGFINTQGSSNAVMTINSSGVQQLTSNYTGEIVISASNVTLDLRGFTIFGGTRGIRITGSNVTVRNGTVRDATIGVRIEGSNNHIFGVDMISNTTGMEIVGNANIIRDCRASNNSAAGFSLVGASRNSLYSCTALDNGSTGNAYGFISQDGEANTFEECVAERTQISGFSSLAAGFVLTGTEQKSKILNSQASNASGSNVYGMRLQGVTSPSCIPLLSELQSATVEIGNAVNSVAWQQIGSSYYVAEGNSNIVGGSEVRVLQFNSATNILNELQSATFEIGANVNSIAWQQIGNSYYLAVGNNSIAGPEVRVLQFNPSTRFLSELRSATFDIGTLVRSVAWQQIGSSYYVAVGNQSIAGAEVRVLQFNPVVEILSELQSATVEIGVNVRSVAWQQIGSSYYVAVGNASIAGPEVRVLQFNPATRILSELRSATVEIGVEVFSVAWQQIGNSYYLAVGNSGPVAGPEVRVLQFNPATGILSELRSATFEIGDVAFSVAWQQIGSSYYIAVGNSTTGANLEVRVLQFNFATGILSELPSATFDIGISANSVAWQQIGSSYYVAAGYANNLSGVEIRVLQFDDCQRFPSNNIIMQNQSSGNEIGFQDDASINSLNQWLGNFGANNTTNFNIGTQFPLSSSQGLGDGVADNLDASLTNGGPAQKIMATVVDQLTTLTGPMAVKNALLAQYGVTPIVGTTTLTSMRSYCLANDTSGTIFILTSSFILLDLNQHTVGNIVVSNSQFLDIENGRVNPNSASTDGISFTNSSNIFLQKINVANAQNGLIFVNTTGRDSAMMVQNCTFNNNSQIGFRIVNGTYPNKPQDIYCYQCAARNNGSHGFSIGSEGSKYYQCEATNNGGRGFTLENAAVLTGWNIPASTDQHNLFAECVSMNNTGTGFHMQASQAANVVAACYARGNGGANYSAGIRWGVVADTTTDNVYWCNTAQSLP